jgi:superoxide dismutase, Fe-Mn family
MAMASYTLPELPYSPGALEPHYSGEIVELHHDKHHAAYVKGANDTLEQLAAAREAGDFSAINMLTRSFAFHLSGHVLHSIFWTNMSPDGGGRPEGELAAAIDEVFGGFDVMQAQLTAATIPLLVIDSWEHAYYLQYKNVKADWVKAFWNIVNWPDVDARFARARTVPSTT